MKILIFTVIITIFIEICTASVGDKSKYFKDCLKRCSMTNCEGDEFVDTKSQPFLLKLLKWSCPDECDYDCMWQTTDVYISRGYTVPQFHGKWPFTRFLGIQEPASVLFSLMNLYEHLKGLKKIRRQVSANCPTFLLWHLYSFVCVNAWIWSTVFHTRDFPKTEFLDYSCAFSMVLMFCYSMVMRVLNDAPRAMRIIITVFVIAFYANHITYLGIGKFDYAYNMKVNVIVGTFTALGWFAWCLYNRHRQPYVTKCATFVALIGITTFLEFIDRPPFFFVLDSHALWHLSTALTIPIFYSFIVDDCNYLTQAVAYKENAKMYRRKKYVLALCILICTYCLYVPVVNRLFFR